MMMLDVRRLLFPDMEPTRAEQALQKEKTACQKMMIKKRMRRKQKTMRKRKKTMEEKKPFEWVGRRLICESMPLAELSKK